MKTLFYTMFLVLLFSGCGGNGSSSNNKDDDKHNDGQNNGGGNYIDKNVASGYDKMVQDGNYTILAWNDLGMHCVDGKDYSVFSILPPYNNLNAQLIKKDGTSDKHVTSGVTLTYKSSRGVDKSINTTSEGKTNFWDYVEALFGGNALAQDVGLTGNKTPSHTPQPLKYNSSHNWWEADGIPIINYNDDGTKNYYPLVTVTAKDSSGKVLASTNVVLPVSDEMDCRKCHASNSNDEAKPSNGWENNTDELKDYKLNILKLHRTISSSKLAELKTKGYTYQSSLYDTAKAGTPILCASCHKSNALGTSGLSGVPSLTKALHSRHANVKDKNGVRLNDATNRNACYSCHPGATTKCLRGAMGNVDEIQCQSCHGGMDAVGSDREGWLDEPNCQSCHHDGVRDKTAVTSFTTGTLKDTLNNGRFATNANKPSNGHSLYRFSTGHGKMQCSACHGSTHAIYPSSHDEDNLQSIGVQGHKGTINDCTSCHTSVPSTTNKGPHGMHTTGKKWERDHRSIAENNGVTDCKACHGQDLRGSSLSKMFSDKKLDHKTYKQGDKVSCYDCHGKKW